MKIFVSHISEEAPIAIVLKNWIESTFLGQHEVFVSSSPNDIPAGSKWLEKIDTALNESNIYLVLCSPTSITRNWINFETGCAWIKKVPVIPICHSGVTKGNLPSPLSFFQAMDLNNELFPKDMFDVISKYLEVTKLPRISFSEMTHELKTATNQVGVNKSTVIQKIKQNHIAIPLNTLGGETIIVGTDNTSDVKSITEALKKIGPKGQIFIKSGIYEEKYLTLHGPREYRLIGEDRDNVIIFGSLSIDCYEADISNISVIAKDRASVCGNIQCGKNKILNCKFSRGRDGLMIQKSTQFKNRESETTIINCLFTDNYRGIWIGISGRAILRNNKFENNLIGIVNAEDLKQKSIEIAEENKFIDNSRADYVTGWDYNDGTMSNFFNWEKKTKSFTEIKLKESLRKIEYDLELLKKLLDELK